MIRRWVHRHDRIRGVLRRLRSLWWRVRATRPRRRLPGTDYPRTFQIAPPPRAIEGEWRDPPVTDNPFARLETATPDPPPRHYDVALFESLNAEYASRPIVTNAPRYDPASLVDRSRRRILNVHRQIDLRRRTVLEVGCGSGYEVWHLAHQLGCDAWGIDISPRRSWADLEGERVHLIAGDIADPGTLPPAAFDRVISFTVWEHITRPLEAIEQLAHAMKPGGLAWIRANLYRGPTASHRYRDIFFPFPHLLFSDAVIDEAMERAGRARGGSAWVNRLTWEQYEAAFLRAGFRIRALDFTIAPLDEPFFARFEDVLGRYPRADLERSFFQVILEKPRRRR